MLYDIFVNLLASLVWVILAWVGSRLYKRIKLKRITKTGNTTCLKSRNDNISKAEFQDTISWHMIFIVMGIVGMCHTFLIYPIQPNESMRTSCVVFFLIYLAALVVSLATLIRSLKKSYYAICDQQSKETSNQ